MNFQFPHFSAALPEIFLLSMTCLVLLTELFMKYSRSVVYVLSQVALLGTAILFILGFNNISYTTFNGHLIFDALGSLLGIFICIIACIAFIYAKHYTRDRNIPNEYYILGLFSTLGMLVMVTAQSFLMIYLGLELLSLPLYAMVALQKDSPTATEAAMKYFVMGAIASGMLLYGLSLLYGVSGSLNLPAVASAITTMPEKQHLVLVFALVFVIAGLGFKLAAAPFHMWAPDVYTGAPTAVTAFLASAPKIAALGMAFRLLITALPQIVSQWHELLIILSVLSITIGNVIAIAQSNLKRMLAYSAIAHIGYMLLGLLSGNAQGYSAALFYILVYSIMSVGGFGMIVLLSRRGFEAENIEDFKGLNSRNPWLAFMMMLLMLSMAGVPPTVGFFAKLLVLKAVVQTQMVWLAVFAVLLAIVGAFYYLRVIKTMYFDAPGDPTPIACASDTRLMISINSLALLVLGIFPGALLEVCRVAFGL
ncbi:MAG: NADH-quinone oxidoreductase subunit NuoN [Proteobacteria bacterium]|nr:NADH-quinone oxidoreductase subunit NuoN [Pseudomonadota bacterium]